MITIEVAEKVLLGVNVVRDVSVSGNGSDLLAKVANKLREKYDLDDLKAHPVVRAYRDFYWKIGIDPTKQRPSGEALVRRALRGKVPSINNVVDAGNAASMETFVPIGLYNLDRVKGKLRLRYAREGEQFIPIGGKEEKLRSNQIVLADDEKVLHVFPYRDSRLTMITEETRNVLVVACGVPGVDAETIMKACSKASEYIVRLAGGDAEKCVLV
ncbi:B3/B4 domain-containing protein [Archaeoglobus sp.]